MISASGRKEDIAGPYIIMENEVVMIYSLVWTESEGRLIG